MIDSKRRCGLALCIYRGAVPELPDLRDHVRAEPIADYATVLVRGGPDSTTKLEAHAERVRRAFVLDGAPVLGISVFAALDDIGPGFAR